MLNHRRRSSERGQTLILAVAFLAYFAVFTAAVLAFASTVESQRHATERTASQNSLADGSAQFALSDTGLKPCGTVTGGSMSFGSDSLAFAVPPSNGCVASSASNATKPGSACVVCILNSTPINPQTKVLNGDVSVNGEVDVNGSVSGSVNATKIGLLTGGTCSSCNPAAQPLMTPFTDPLAGHVPIPSSGGPVQSCCSSNLIHPGVYSGMSVEPGTVWLTTGVYVVTGQINIAGAAGRLANSDVSNAADSESAAAVTQGGGGTTDSDTGDSGTGSAYTATTLTDGTKNWVTSWIGAVVSVTHKKAVVTGTVTANTNNKLTVSKWSGNTPSTGDKYVVSPVSYTSNTLVDSSKTWVANTLGGKVVTVTLSDGTLETNTITSNSTHQLNLATWSTTPVPVNSYVLSSVGYTSTTLVDGSKTWVPGTLVNKVVTVTLSDGTLETGIVASNTGTALTMTSAWPSTPAPGNLYAMSTVGYTTTTLTDGTKNWSNVDWTGAVVTVTLSANTTVTGVVTGNNRNTLTVKTPWTTTPVPGDAYVVTKISFTANSLTDSSKGSWIPTQWVGALVTVTLPDSTTETATVASNTANGMVMSANWKTTPPPGSTYSIDAQVVVYLACPTTGPHWSCGASGQPGGNINTSGNGAFALSAYKTGPYAGISVFADPNLTNPGGTNCSVGSNCAIEVAGNGGSFDGTVYLPRASMDMTGNGSASIGGRIIVMSLSMGGNGGINLSGAAPVSAATCYIYNDYLYVNNTAQTTPQGHVQFETNCSSGGINGQGVQSSASIINFAYGDGP